MNNSVTNSVSKKVPGYADLDRYVSKQEVMIRYGISERTLQSWIRTKKIPYLRISAKAFRYRLADVEKALARYRVNEVEA